MEQKLTTTKNWENIPYSYFVRNRVKNKGMAKVATKAMILPAMIEAVCFAVSDTTGACCSLLMEGCAWEYS
jgi:hypothetical protein